MNAHSTRRAFLRTAAASAAATLPAFAQSAVQESTPALTQRPEPGARRFSSPAVEAAVASVGKQIADPELALIFANCFPNTLDTTVTPGMQEGKPDTFVITGDIDAMWLRDSSAQVWPYLPFCKQDPKLATLIEGVIRRQTRCILLDPYANAFLPDTSSKPLSWSTQDHTDLKPGVGERKWEIDSLCYPIRLAHGFWRATGSELPFDEQWRSAAGLIVKTFREQQRKDGRGPYHFQRAAYAPTDSLPLDGYGNPARPVGLIFSGFRPSDDACIYPLFIPANLFALRSLGQLAELATAVHDDALASDARSLADEVARALAQYAYLKTDAGTVWAYEVDGYGNTLRMDDANAPGLLSMDYLGCVQEGDRGVYQRTRAWVLSDANPYFFRGKAGEGVGGPHEGLGWIWPMSIIFRAFSSTDDRETLACLRTLRDTTAGTHFMHESFWLDDAGKYTRPWFAWANTLFGELILTLAVRKPELLRQNIA